MWIYEKKLQFPVDVKCKDLKFAKTLITQYGGPAGELTACLQYLNQRFTMPTGQTKALLTDIGTEEIAHLEIIGTMVSQIMQNASMCDLKEAGLDGYYSLHDHGLFYTDPNGYNWTADYVDGLNDPITDLTANISAEQKAKQTYEYLMDLACGDESLLAPLRFLREREVVHYQRFGEALETVKDYYNQNKYFC